MSNGGVSELEGTVHETDVLREHGSQVPVRNLNISEDFAGCLLAVDFECFKSRVLESSIKALGDSHLLRLISQELLDTLRTVQQMTKLIPFAGLLIFFFL